MLDLEREIVRLIERKRGNDLQIIDLEARIHGIETVYLQETSQFGSLLGGLEGYLGGAPLSISASLLQTPSQPSSRRPQGSGSRREISDADRLFSHTSSSYSRVRATLPHRAKALMRLPLAQSAAPSSNAPSLRLTSQALAVHSRLVREGSLKPLPAEIAPPPAVAPPSSSGPSRHRPASPSRRRSKKARSRSGGSSGSRATVKRSRPR